MGGPRHRDGAQEELEPTASLTSPQATHKELEIDTRLQVTRLQSAVIPHFDGVGVRVVKGALQMGSGLTL